MNKYMFTLVFLLFSVIAQAQNYPNKNITLIVPFAAGGATDVVARLMAEDVGKHLGQTIIVENVAGAGGGAGLTRLTKAEPDGYTVLFGNTGTNAAAFTLFPDLKYTPDDFQPVILVSYHSSIIGLKLGFPANNMAEFLDYAKKNPGAISLAHAGIGSANHLICMSFIKATGIDVKLIGYRGGGPALNDLMGGHVDGSCSNASSLAGAIVTSKVKGLVVSGDKPISSLPNLPTAKASNIPAFEANSWHILYAPKKTPSDIVMKLNAAFKQSLTDPKLIARLEAAYGEAPSANELTPQFASKFNLKETMKYKELLKDVVVPK